MTRISDERMTVLIADSNSISCQLFASCLDDSPYPFRVVASATDITEVLEAVGAFEPDVALIASQLRGSPQDGFRALAGIRNGPTKTRVVMLLDSAEDAQIINAFRGGARGVFFRSSSIECLPKCLWSVCRGQVWASSRELRLVLDMLARTAPLRMTSSYQSPALTRREEQVVRLAAAGLTNREISSQLHLSAHTVKNYIFRLYNKLGVSNRVELAAYSSSQGWPPGIL